MSLAPELHRPTVDGPVERYLAEQCRVILDADGPLRRGSGSIHDTRVAIRRLRSTLRVFAEAFEPEPVARLETDLSWYAAELGAVRDREVLALRLEDAIAALPSRLVLGPVSTHIVEQLHGELTFFRGELIRTMAGDRYRRLLIDVSEWEHDAPYTSVAHEPDRLLTMSTKAASKAKRRLGKARGASDQATALHRARKAAKRARYSAELVEPFDGENAGARVRHFKRVQTELGAYQDSVIAAELLRRLGAGAGTLPGHNGFTYGVLYQRELRAGEVARDAALALFPDHPPLVPDHPPLVPDHPPLVPDHPPLVPDHPSTDRRRRSGCWDVPARTTDAALQPYDAGRTRSQRDLPPGTSAAPSGVLRSAHIPLRCLRRDDDDLRVGGKHAGHPPLGNPPGPQDDHSLRRQIETTG